MRDANQQRVSDRNIKEQDGKHGPSRGTQAGEAEARNKLAGVLAHPIRPQWGPGSGLLCLP